MRALTRQMHSDFLKLRNTPFFLLHIAIPALGILIFGAYTAITPYQAQNMFGNFFQLLSLVYPLIAAWVCGIIAEQEIEAGGGFYMLSVPFRTSIIASKLLLLLGLGLLSCLLSTVGFGLLFPLIRPSYHPPLGLCIEGGLLVWVCAVVSYLLHFWLALRFSKSVGFAVAAVEILLASLMLTGLGEGIWFFVPSAWGMRLLGMLWGSAAGSAAFAMPMIFITSVLMLVILLIWFHSWEGRRQEE